MAEGKKPFRWVELEDGRRYMETDMGHVFYKMEPTGERRMYGAMIDQFGSLHHSYAFQSGSPEDDPEKEYLEKLRPLETMYSQMLAEGVFMPEFGHELSKGDYAKCDKVLVRDPIEPDRLFAVDKGCYELVYASVMQDTWPDGLAPLNHLCSMISHKRANDAIFDALTRKRPAPAADGKKALSKEGAQPIDAESVAEVGGNYGVVLAESGKASERSPILALPAGCVRRVEIHARGFALGPSDKRQRSSGKPFVYGFSSGDPSDTGRILVRADAMEERFKAASDTCAKGMAACEKCDSFMRDAPGNMFVYDSRDPLALDGCTVSEYTPLMAEKMAERNGARAVYAVKDADGAEKKYYTLAGMKDGIQKANGCRVLIDSKSLDLDLAGGAPPDALMRGVYDTLRSMNPDIGKKGFDGWMADRAAAAKKKEPAKQAKTGKAPKAPGKGPSRYDGGDIPDVGDSAAKDARQAEGPL